MSMHRVPLTPSEEAGFHAHGLQRHIGKPSQLADVFRQGIAWGEAAERERVKLLLMAIREHWVKANSADCLSVAALDEIAGVIADGSYVSESPP